MAETTTFGASRIVYRKFDGGVSLIEDLEAFALSEGIREAAIVSCIGSLTRLNLRNLCGFDAERSPQFERSELVENLELVTADGYIQPLPDGGGLRVHVHLAAARPSGEVIGGHCEDATTFTGAFMYLQVLDEEGVG